MDREPEQDRRLVLKEALGALERMQKKLDTLEHAQKEPLAIIGMACRFPGHANDPEEFWQLLHNGVDAIEEVPASRWDMEAYYDPDPETAGKICTRNGGFVDDVELFDPQFFGISPREAVGMDPQHRLALEVTWEALESAAQAPVQLVEKRVGVFLGITTRDYSERLTYDGFDDLDAYGLTGNLSAFAAGRISYVLGLQGIAASLDTACSSSLVAIHLGCQSLRSRESDMVLTGGVNLLLWPEISVTESKSHMLAPDGRCKTFDARADGFVRGEGCGVLVIKRLSDALTNGDNILALVRGSYCNQDGASSGLTVPNLRAQKAVIEGALQGAGLGPIDVDYIEAHGTGTSLGDPIELGGLAAVFGKVRGKDNPIMVGSVKTNVGHLESAAGVAGVMKVVLALLHKEIPPHLHFQEPNPHVQWEQVPVVVPTEPTPWPRRDRPRIAGISSFGASGTNAHIIVEEAPVHETASNAGGDGISERPQHVLTISGKSEAALAAVAKKYAAHFEKYPDLELVNAAYTANVGRNHFPYRRAFVASTLEQMRDQLLSFSDGKNAGIGTDSPVRNSDRQKVAFLFTGQGAQKVNMGRRLYEKNPVFRQVMNRCNDILESQLDQSLLSVLYPKQEHESPLDQTCYTQPALFAIEYALSEVWRSWGVVPSAVLGHSIGEYVAACVAGIFSLEDGLKLISERGRLMQELPQGGAMAVALTSEDVVRQAIEQSGDKVTIAAVNGPKNITISGAKEQLDVAIGILEKKGVVTRFLQVSHAFHSQLMEPMMKPFEKIASGISFHKPKLPLISNVEGRFFEPGEVPDAVYWCRHVRDAVRFADGIRALHEKDYGVFLEIGPGPVLIGMARKCIQEDESFWLTSLTKDRDDFEQMLESLASLYVRGASVDWKGFDHGYMRRRIILPSYPFEKKPYWVAPPPPIEQRGRSRSSASFDRTNHPLLQARFRSPLVREVVYEAILNLSTHSFLEDLKIHGVPVFSLAGVVEIACAAAKRFYGDDTYTISGLSLQHALTVQEGENPRIQCILRPDGEHRADIQIISFNEESAKDREIEWVKHATSRIRRTSESTPNLHWPKLQQIRSSCDEEITPADHYATLHQLGFDYGESLRGIEKLFRGEGEALGLIRMSAAVRRERKSYILHPGLLDACLQVFSAAWGGSDEHGIYLPMGIEAIHYITGAEERVWSYAVVRSDDDETLTGDLWILNESEKPLAHLKGVTFIRVDEEGLRRSVGQRKESSTAAISRETQQIDIRQRLAEASAEERYTNLFNWLRTRVAHILRITPAESVDAKVPITSLGLDSIMAMELLGAAISGLGVEMQLGDILSGPSIEELTRELLVKLDHEGAPIDRESTETQGETTADIVASGSLDSAQAENILKNLDQLSEEEVKRVLENISSGEVDS